MLVIALGFVLWPLLRKSEKNESAPTNAAGPVANDASNLAILRNQRAELESELARGAISQATFDSSMQDLAARVNEDAPALIAAKAVPTAQKSNPRSIAYAVVASTLLVGGVTSFYVVFGMPNAVLPQSAMATATGSTANSTTDPRAVMESPELSDAKVREMVDGLAQKMQSRPDDFKGWALLARSEFALGRTDAAIKSFERAIGLASGGAANKAEPNDIVAQLFADYADAKVLQQEGVFDAKVIKLIDKALALDGNNVKAIALSATAAMRANKGDAAIALWQRLQKLVSNNADDVAAINKIIAEIRAPKGAVAANNMAQQSPAPALAVAPAATERKSNAPTLVSGRVTLDASLAAKVSAGDTLFIFARAQEGPKMPLAVLRLNAADLPMDFSLSDAMAMAPGMVLSGFTAVMVEAKISKAGTANRAAGDLIGIAGPVTPGSDAARNIKLVIKQVAP
jgi:cytochrome c-type biogenesis protein CcmH